MNLLASGLIDLDSISTVSDLIPVVGLLVGIAIVAAVWVFVSAVVSIAFAVWFVRHHGPERALRLIQLVVAPVRAIGIVAFLGFYVGGRTTHNMTLTWIAFSLLTLAIPATLAFNAVSAQAEYIADGGDRLETPEGPPGSPE